MDGIHARIWVTKASGTGSSVLRAPLLDHAWHDNWVQQRKPYEYQTDASTRRVA